MSSSRKQSRNEKQLTKTMKKTEQFESNESMSGSLHDDEDNNGDLFEQLNPDAVRDDISVFSINDNFEIFKKQT